MTAAVIDPYAEGEEPVWPVGPNRHLTAAFYRNSIVHFYLDVAIAEVALQGLAGGHGAGPEDPIQAFWDAALDLRDLLTVDFFLAEKEEFTDRLAAELDAQVPDWRERLGRGPDGARSVLFGLRRLIGPATLRSFVEAYGVVADVLCRMPAEVDGRELRRRCLADGRQYRPQGRVHSPDAVSTMLFCTGVELAANQGLLEPGPDLGERRRAFAERVRGVVTRIDAIRALPAARAPSPAAASVPGA